MGHHTIKEVSQERFEFQGKTKLIPILLIILGAVMAGIGSMQVKNNWNDEDSHSETIQTVEEGHHTHTDGVNHNSNEHSMDATTTILLIDNPNSETTHAADESHAEDGHHAHANEHHGPTWMTRVWANLLMNSYYFWLFL